MVIYDQDSEIQLYAKRILDCEDLFSLSKTLRDFLKWLKGQKDKNHKLTMLYRDLKVSSFPYGRSKEKYMILQGREAVREYLFGVWMLCKYYKDNLTLLENSIAYIDKYFVEPQGEIITADRIHHLMRCVDTHFQFSDKVLTKQLPILLLDHSRIDNQSYFSYNLYVPDLVQVKMLYIKDKEATVEQIFLHELGHALHIKLTGSLEIIPDGFISLLSIFFPGIDDLNYKEFFADFFVVAFTWYESTTPTNGFDDVPKLHKEILAKYYYQLIQAIS